MKDNIIQNTKDNIIQNTKDTITQNTKDNIIQNMKDKIIQNTKDNVPNGSTLSSCLTFPSSTLNPKQSATTGCISFQVTSPIVRISF